MGSGEMAIMDLLYSLKDREGHVPWASMLPCVSRVFHTEEGALALLSVRSPEDDSASPRFPTLLHTAVWTLLRASEDHLSIEGHGFPFEL